MEGERMGFGAFLRAYMRWVGARAWLFVKYVLVSVALLSVMFSLFFVAMGIIDLTMADNEWGWLFGGTFLVWLGISALYGKYLKLNLGADT